MILTVTLNPSLDRTLEVDRLERGEVLRTSTATLEPGSPLFDHEIDAVVSLMEENVSVGDWVVMSGSVPNGFSSQHVRRFVAALPTGGINLAVDMSGHALAAAVDAGSRLIKPNRKELAEITCTSLDCISDVIAAVRRVRSRGVEFVAVSLGADGAVLVGGSGVVVGTSRVERPRSTLGAGDSFLAGFLSKFFVDEMDVDAAMLEALAWGAAAASLPGSSVPGRKDIDCTRVQLVGQPDLDRPLVASGCTTRNTPTPTPFEGVQAHE